MGKRASATGVKVAKRHQRYCLTFYLAGLLIAVAAQPALACKELARTELETLFCQIQSTREGARLPSFQDFRRNAPSVQAALLKGPARRLRLAVPQPAASSPSARQPSPPQPAAASTPEPDSPSNRTQPDRGQSLRALVTAPPVDANPPAKPTPRSNRRWDDCQLRGEQIRCPRQRWRLVRNQPNAALPEGVLSDSNRLVMDRFTGGGDSELHAYLVDSYRRYIEKMLEIGLGASTMSYTRFFYTYQEMVAQGQDFAERFETMFAYLKRDKRALQVKPRYNDELPDDLSQCDRLGTTLVVCDDRHHNWVYRQP